METEPLSLEDKGWSLLKDKRHRQGLMVRLTEWLSMDGPRISTLCPPVIIGTFTRVSINCQPPITLVSVILKTLLKASSKKQQIELYADEKFFILLQTDERVSGQLI